MPDFIWHTKTAKQAADILNTSLQGLDANKVETQRQKYGSNSLPESRPDSIWLIFLRQFQSPLIYILVVAGILILTIGEYTDAVIIFLVLLFNAVVGTLQEGKAQNTLASLKKLVETKATVLRSGLEEIIPDIEVVAGDVLVLREGDKIPADARIISAHNLTVDESSLTGESQPVYKIENPLKLANLATAEQKNMLFKGTNVVAGSGMAIVTATGIKTIIGGISQKIAGIESEDPIKRDVRKLSKVIIVTVAVICTSLFVVGLLAGKSGKEMFTTVVSLSVSIIPEGLPIVLTLVLATGVWRMSKKNALVKKLQAVESLGQASIIAVDKTGTITKNELTVTEVFVDGNTYIVEGNGYEPKGNILQNGAPGLQNSGLQRLAKLSVFCANAHVAFSEEKQTWQVSGDPTEAALLVFAEKAGIIKTVLEKESPQIAEIPFSYQSKYHTTLHKTGLQGTITLAGAPEAVLKLCSSVWHEKKNSPLTESKLLELEKMILHMSGQGLRVLALALKNTHTTSLDAKNLDDLVFVGFVGMKDVLRPEVKEALTNAHEAGIKVVMITGDHKLTAQAIGKEAGIFSHGDKVLSGAEIEGMSDAALAQTISNVTVFARVTPEHKLRIIQAYKQNGEIIAMTGDGVNDAPPLVAADLGVAMGKIGTEVAKEAADIILLDDNFGSIVSAVEEGRSIYKTIKKVILYLFSTSLGEVLTITISIFLGFPLPVLASQIIWLNFVTDGFLDVSLAMEPKEHGLLKEPRTKKTVFIDPLMAKRMVFMAIPMSVGSLWLFSRYVDVDIVKAQTITLTALAAFQWFNAWNCRSEKKSIFQISFWSNRFLIAATATVITLQLFAVYNPFMQKFLKTTGLSLKEWILIILVASTIIIVEELRKWNSRRLNK